jgi:hypothetical protein
MHKLEPFSTLVVSLLITVAITACSGGSTPTTQTSKPEPKPNPTPRGVVVPSGDPYYCSTKANDGSLDFTSSATAGVKASAVASNLPVTNQPDNRKPAEFFRPDVKGLMDEGDILAGERSTLSEKPNAHLRARVASLVPPTIPDSIKNIASWDDGAFATGSVESNFAFASAKLLQNAFEKNAEDKEFAIETCPVVVSYGTKSYHVGESVGKIVDGSDYTVNPKSSLAPFDGWNSNTHTHPLDGGDGYSLEDFYVDSFLMPVDTRGFKVGGVAHSGSGEVYLLQTKQSADIRNYLSPKTRILLESYVRDKTFRFDFAVATEVANALTKLYKNNDFIVTPLGDLRPSVSGSGFKGFWVSIRYWDENGLGKVGSWRASESTEASGLDISKYLGTVLAR